MRSSLDRSQLVAELHPATVQALSQLEIHPQLDSTNHYLMTRANEGMAGGFICIAEQQTQGRGRRGKIWYSPAANLYLSLLWRFNGRIEILHGLSLAVGVAIANALRALGIQEVGLKWPNDVWWQKRKLGGILVECGQATNECYAVIGVGINVQLPVEIGQYIEQPWCDLHTVLGRQCPSRERLAATVINQLILMMQRFEQIGLPEVLTAWRRFDCVNGETVVVHLPHKILTGRACGLDDHGALLIENAQGIHTIHAGEVSLRIA